VRCALILCLCPQLALAGAWPRDDGGVFVAVSGNPVLTELGSGPVHFDPSVYLEYGLTDKLTLGLDLHTSDQTSVLIATAFARLPLPLGGEANRWAATASLGTRQREGHEPDPLFGLGLSWGRGLERGWIAADAGATLSVTYMTVESKLDITWGHHFGDRFSTIVQLQSGLDESGSPYARIRPTLAWKATDWMTVELGAVQALTGSQVGGLSVASWFEF
jgi:hypothetical protein